MPTPKRVLVVEDDPDAREGMEKALRHKGHQVITARTAAEALKRMDWKPQVIVLDLMLPGESGLSVLEHVRTRKLPITVVVATGTGATRILKDAEELHPDEVYHKPVDWTELAQKLADETPAE